MPTIIRNQSYALIRRSDDRNEGGHALFYPMPINARNDDEAQELALGRIRDQKLTGMFVLVRMIADYEDGAGPSAVYEGGD